MKKYARNHPLPILLKVIPATLVFLLLCAISLFSSWQIPFTVKQNQVYAYSVFLSTTQGPPGTQGSISGSGWTPKSTRGNVESIDIRFGSSSDPNYRIDFPTAPILPDGTFQTTFTIPPNATPGNYTFWAVNTDPYPDEDASTSFTVTSSPNPTNPPINLDDDFCKANDCTTPTPVNTPAPTSSPTPQYSKSCKEETIDGKRYTVCKTCTQQSNSSPICTTTQEPITGEPAQTPTPTPKTSPSSTPIKAPSQKPNPSKEDKAVLGATKKPTEKPKEKKEDTKTRKKLFILLQGIDSGLNKDDKYGVDFDQANGIGQALKKQFPRSDIMPFSYNGVDSSGKPKLYNCAATFTKHLKDDVGNLNSEITKYLKNHPNTDVYLIGHSLGGVVAYAYLTALTEKIAGISIPTDSKLKAVATLDSPIGGVPNAGFPIFADLYYKQGFEVSLGSAKKKFPQCKEIGNFPIKIISDLINIYDTDQLHEKNNNIGGSASISDAVFQSKKITNGDLARKAQKLGTRVIAFGNTNDFLWNPQPCLDSTLNPIYRTNLRVPNFNTTQWLANPDHNSSVSIITEGFNNCGISLGYGLNHKEVLEHQPTINSLIDFFNSAR